MILSQEALVPISRVAEDVASAALTIWERVSHTNKIIMVEGVDNRFEIRMEFTKSPLMGVFRYADERFVDESASCLGSKLEGTEVQIVLEASRFLCRTLDLPEQAEGFLNGIVGGQIDRLTPWSASQAAFGHGAPTPLSKGRVAVTVVAIALARITPFVEAIDAFKPAAVVVFAASGSSGERIMVLTRHTNLKRRLRRARNGLAAALALAGAAATISFGLWIIVGGSLAAAREQVSQQIAERRAAIGRRLGVGNEAVEALAQKKRLSVATVVVLEQLSRALPDDTHLTRMKIEDGKVQIAGVTRDAASLIGILERTETFQRATFSAATTQMHDEDDKQFEIEADIKPTLKVLQ